MQYRSCLGQTRDHVIVYRTKKVVFTMLMIYHKTSLITCFINLCIRLSMYCISDQVKKTSLEETKRSLSPKLKQYNTNSYFNSFFYLKFLSGFFFYVALRQLPRRPTPPRHTFSPLLLLQSKFCKHFSIFIGKCATLKQSYTWKGFVQRWAFRYIFLIYESVTLSRKRTAGFTKTYNKSTFLSSSVAL